MVGDEPEVPSERLLTTGDERHCGACHSCAYCMITARPPCSQTRQSSYRIKHVSRPISGCEGVSPTPVPRCAWPDPRREVESTLGSTRALLDSYERVASSSSSATSPAVLEARKELQGTLALLEADLEDLEESVRAVEQTGDRWGIEEHEVRRRRQFVERIKAEVRVCRRHAQTADLSC